MGKLTLALAAGENPLAPATSEPWVTPDQLSGCSPSADVDLDSVCQVASELMFLWSGKKYGVRTETVRPRAGDPHCGWQYIGMNSQWRTYYGEGQPNWLFLKAPVRGVFSVKIDGVALDPSEYMLYDDRKLVRGPTIDNLVMHWPIYQRIDLADTEVGTFSVSYQWGRDVPLGGQVAAQAFACELTKYLSDQPSSLPDRLISINRQGVTQTIEDPNQFLKNGRTGLYVCDAWLGAVNPYGNRRKPRIVGADSVNLNRTDSASQPNGYGYEGYGY